MSNKKNIYQSLIDTRDAATLIALAYSDEPQDPLKRTDLIEALELVLSIDDYDAACGKRTPANFDDDYLNMVFAIDHLTGTPNYQSRNNYYFNLLETLTNATTTDKELWYSEIEKNIEAALLLDPMHVDIMHQKVYCFNLRAKDTAYTDMNLVANLLDLIKSVVDLTASYTLWHTWLNTITTLRSDAGEAVQVLILKSEADFTEMSRAQYASGRIDPLLFIEQIGHDHFLNKLPKQLEKEAIFWLHEAIKKERLILDDLTVDKLRDDGILFLNAFKHYAHDRSIIEHVVTLTEHVWKRSTNWNTFHFLLEAKVVLAHELQKEGDIAACLDIFKRTKESAVDVVLRSIVLSDLKNFSFANPLLTFYEAYEAVVPTEEERRALLKEHLQIASASTISGDGYHVFPYVHLLTCEAYFDMAEAFEKTWIELFIHLYPHIQHLQVSWERSPLVMTHPDISATFKKTAAYYNREAPITYDDYGRKLDQKLHDMDLHTLRTTLDTFLVHITNPKF